MVTHMALTRHSIPTSEQEKKLSSSVDSSLRNHPLPTISSPQSDPVSSIIKKLERQYYPQPNSAQKPRHSHPHPLPSDPTHTHTHTQFLTKSSSLSSTTNSSFLNKSRKTAQNPKKEKSNKSKKESAEEKLVIEEDEEPKRTSISSIVSVGRRKSLCDSKIELKEFLASATARIVAVDMAPFMQIHAVSCARKTQDSLEKHSPRILASTLKKEFDGVYGPAWHCIVGTSFGSFVTHSVGGFLYFSIDHKLYFLLFKTTVQKADWVLILWNISESFEMFDSSHYCWTIFIAFWL